MTGPLQAGRKPSRPGYPSASSTGIANSSPRRAASSARTGASTTPARGMAAIKAASSRSPAATATTRRIGQHRAFCESASARLPGRKTAAACHRTRSLWAADHRYGAERRCLFWHGVLHPVPASGSTARGVVQGPTSKVAINAAAHLRADLPVASACWRDSLRNQHAAPTERSCEQGVGHRNHG